MKTVYIYAMVDGLDFQMYDNCTDVHNNDRVLSFKDKYGDYHLTVAPWEVVTKAQP